MVFSIRSLAVPARESTMADHIVAQNVNDFSALHPELSIMFVSLARVADAAARAADLSEDEAPVSSARPTMIAPTMIPRAA